MARKAVGRESEMRAAVAWQEPNVLQVSGEVGFATVASLRQQGDALIARAPSNFLVDLQGLDSTHSVALSLLMRWATEAQRQSKSYQIRGMPSKLLDVARVSGLEQVLPLAESDR